MEYTFRKATLADFDSIMNIIEEAKAQMAHEGKHQWDKTYPAHPHIMKDIQAGVAHVMSHAGQPHGLREAAVVPHAKAGMSPDRAPRGISFVLIYIRFCKNGMHGKKFLFIWGDVMGIVYICNRETTLSTS